MFGGVYVAIGMLIVSLTIATRATFCAAPITLGSPLIAPFAGVGLFEIIRRLERGEPLA